MAYVVQPVQVQVVQIPDSDLAAYLAAGWTQATSAQVAAWQQADPYAGRQGTLPTPVRPGAPVVPPPPTKRATRVE